jgi:endonuclease III
MTRVPQKLPPSKAEIQRVFEILSEQYGSAKTELTYESTFQLLVAVILSAQCTDARVNLTTPLLFRQYPTAEALSKADQQDVENLIFSVKRQNPSSAPQKTWSKSLREEFRGRWRNSLLFAEWVVKRRVSC